MKRKPTPPPPTVVVRDPLRTRIFGSVLLAATAIVLVLAFLFTVTVGWTRGEAPAPAADSIHSSVEFGPWSTPCPGLAPHIPCYTDADTGCQYYVISGDIEPRRNIGGAPICGDYNPRDYLGADPIPEPLTPDNSSDGNQA